MTARSVCRRLLGASLFALLTLSAVACRVESAQSALDPEGPVARQQHNLFVPVFWIAAAIFVLVEGLIILVAIKFRQRSADQPEPKQIHGNARLELGWTLAPALILLAVAIPTVITINEQEAPAAAGALHVKVVGHQWWWEYQYPDFDIVTANEMVIPVDREIYLELESEDVIHSFWVPKLAGKKDVVPARTNTMRIQADVPDQTYFGQCAEFCAISHANMRLRVKTMSASGFDQWVREQQAPAFVPEPGSLAARGKQLFDTIACINCHTTQVGGGAKGIGPNLAHLASREVFAGAIFELDHDNLLAWVKDAPSRKPMYPPRVDPNDPERKRLLEGGNKGMPSFLGILTDDEIEAIVAYLMSLR